MAGLVPAAWWLDLHSRQQAERYSLYRRDAPPPAASGNVAKLCCPALTRCYGLKRLFWREYHDTIGGAIQRGRNMKHRRCGFILALNPDWNDLYDQLDGWDKPGHDRECGTIEHLSARMGAKALRKKSRPETGRLQFW